MKKVIVLSLFCMMGILNGYSQGSKMTPDELRFRNSIEQFLKEEGYIPTIDDDDNSLNYKKEGNRYWITVKGDAPYYVQLNRSGFSMDDVDRKLILEACNEANWNECCGKACVSSSSIVFTVEFYCYSIDAFKAAFYDNMRAVDSVRNATSDYYNEHK